MALAFFRRMSGQLYFWINELLCGRRTVEANTFLLNYTEGKECWQQALSLLESENMEIRYFAANIIYNKVFYSILQGNDLC